MNKNNFARLTQTQTFTLDFLEVPNYPELLKAVYLYNDGEPADSWLISKESFLKMKDTADGNDLDYWVKNSNHFDETHKPTPPSEVVLVSQSFLDDPKRFWDLEREVFNSDRVNIKGLIPIYLSYYDHAVYQLDYTPMRLPQIVILRDSCFDLNKVKEVLQNHEDIICLEHKYNYYNSELWVTIKTINLPLPTDIFITPGIIEDNFIHQYGKYAKDLFKINDCRLHQ